MGEFIWGAVLLMVLVKVVGLAGGAKKSGTPEKPMALQEPEQPVVGLAGGATNCGTPGKPMALQKPEHPVVGLAGGAKSCGTPEKPIALQEPEHPGDAIAAMEPGIPAEGIQLRKVDTSPGYNGLNSQVTLGGYEKPGTKNKKRGTWVPLGASAVVGGKTIERGGFYLGGKLDDLYGYSTDAALIDDTLKSIPKDMHYEDDTLGYWPKYFALSPGARGAFLKWLASDRDDPATPLGYVFIYFYGLERRILVDAAKTPLSGEELSALREEIVRLRKIYSGSRSFARYSSQLLAHLLTFNPALIAATEDALLLQESPLYFKHRLATSVHSGNPLSPSLAFAWIAYHSEYRLRTPARRCPEEFFKLFEIEYRKAFGEGLTVKENKSQFPREFTPASPSLRGYELPRLDLRDPSRLTAPLKRLGSLVESSTDQLAPYSKYVGSNGMNQNDLAGMLLLPNALLHKTNPEILRRFKKWAFEKCMNHGGVVSIEDLWQLTGESVPDKLLKRQHEFLQNLMDVSGFGMAPDPRYHYAKPEVDGEVVLYPVGHDATFKPSEHFFSALMAMRLGALMADADGSIDASEVEFLLSILSSHQHLSKVEELSLRAYLQWLIRTGSNRSGLKANIQSLKPTDKALIRSHLVGLVLADGMIHKDEIKQLEKFYGMLGLDAGLVTTDLHESQTRRGAKTPPHAVSPVEPDQRTLKAAINPAGLRINAEMVDRHQQDTHEVQALLQSIFGEELDDDVQGTVATQPDSNTREDGGIDSVHFALFEAIIARDAWPLDQLEDLCKQYGLMAAAAIETINDWSFEQVGAAVLVEENDLEVDQEIKEELISLES